MVCHCACLWHDKHNGTPSHLSVLITFGIFDASEKIPLALAKQIEVAPVTSKLY